MMTNSEYAYQYQHSGSERSKKLKTRKTVRITALIMIMLMIFSVFMTGCGNKAEEESKESSTASQEQNKEDTAETKTVTFKDDCGREVKVPEKIETVIASGPLAQMFLLAVAPDTLIATNSQWSNETKKYIDDKYLKLPEVGSFFGNHDLNYEEIAKLNPQIIIDVGEDKPSMKSDLQDITDKTNIPAVHISANFDNTDKAFSKLGKLLGREDKGNKLAAFCKDAFDSAEAVIKKTDKKKQVMYCTQEDGLNVLAKDSYHSQIIDMLADNVAVLEDPSSQGTGNEVNIEQMINWDPEIIIFEPNSYYDFVSDDPAWKTLRAVKNNKYYEVPMGPYNWMGFPPSCNRVLGLLWTAQLLYPDKTDFDLKEEVQEYYKLFYQYDLSDSEYEKLVKKSILK